MNFTTPVFLAFLVIVFSLYWLLPRRGQNLLILAASLVFYAWWDWRFVFLLLGISLTDFAVARLMMQEDRIPWRKALLGFSLASNLGALAFFKYSGFFLDSLRPLIGTVGILPGEWVVRLVLPIGISFYTFQALSYTIDVYRRQLKAVDSVVEYLCFITFFPHMVAGPIQQAKHLLGQFERDRAFDQVQATDGLRQMLWGYTKKTLIADNLAPIVELAYADPEHSSGLQLLCATYLFAIQIYCDFSGYTDIAIGCARLFDLHLTRNFAYPYFAANIRSFWRRWHISLSAWFREYVYFPLGGNRRGTVRTVLNIMIVFLLSGFWHGANWTFLIWGALHGAFYVTYMACTGWRDEAENTSKEKFSLVRFVSIVATFHLVCLAWVFFRAESASQAVMILGKCTFGWHEATRSDIPIRWLLLGGALLGFEWAQRHRLHGLDIAHWPRPARWFLYYALVAAIMAFGRIDYVPFIYFQF